MGMSTHVIGFKPADDKFKKMLTAWDACIAAGVKPSEEITAFFGTQWRTEVDAAGVQVDVRSSDAVRKWRGDCREGYEVDLRELDPDIKVLRFYNSW
jgi:uncharacterized protein YfbU (UPF0304 family)